MEKENMEKLESLLSQKQIRRMKIINDYLYEMGNFIKEKKLSPNRAQEILARKYETTKPGIIYILKNAGVYKNKTQPIIFPSEEEKKMKPNYFF